MAEECEHKTVAFDVYQELYGTYWPRALGVLHGSVHVLGLGFVGMRSALKQDGDHGWLPRAIGTARQLLAVAVKVSPFLLRALGPSYNPRQESEPEWLEHWQRYHALQGDKGPMPVIDTTSETMALPAS